MITDQFLKVSAAQAVTATAVSTDKVDLSVARDIGEGEDLYMNFSVDTSFTAAGAATMEMQVVVADDAALSTNVTVVGTTGAIAKTALVAGANFAARINPQIASLGRRYFGANYVVSTGPMTAGAITANVVHDIQDGKKFYASGFSVV